MTEADPVWHRPVVCRYVDPLDLVWTRTAERCGMRVRRAADVFACWDGAGTLTLGSTETLDADDCLGQMIFHEICHALVEGPRAFHQPDWGLENTDDSHLVREHACLRLQAAMTDAFGLRRFFAPTTEHRRYYDTLDGEPLQGSEPAVAPARAGYQRATAGPWADILVESLAATKQLLMTTAPFASSESIWGACQNG